MSVYVYSNLQNKRSGLSRNILEEYCLYVMPLERQKGIFHCLKNIREGAPTDRVAEWK